jgi:hypothetical protein
VSATEGRCGLATRPQEREVAAQKTGYRRTMEEWESFAAALHASPGVEEVRLMPGMCGRREGGWVSIQVDGEDLTCNREAEETTCRAAQSCYAWDGAAERRMPDVAVLTQWGSYPTLAVEYEEATDTLPALVTFADHVALRTPTEWVVTRTAVEGRIDADASLDVSVWLGEPGWLLTTATADGCSQGGSRRWSSTVWRQSGGWLEAVEARATGYASWIMIEDRRGRFGDVRLLPKLVPDGLAWVFRRSGQVDDGEAAKLRDAGGVYVYEGGAVVRAR